MDEGYTKGYISHLRTRRALLLYKVYGQITPFWLSTDDILYCIRHYFRVQLFSLVLAQLRLFARLVNFAILLMLIITDKPRHKLKWKFSRRF